MRNQFERDEWSDANILQKALRSSEEKAKQADIDSLTGLLNRRSLEPRFNRMMEDLKYEGAEGKHRLNTNAVLFLFMDLDRLKELNDTRGHKSGDEALCIVADILKKEEERGGCAARPNAGGDEFLFLQRLPHNGELPTAISERIRNKVNHALATAGFPSVTISVGFEVIKNPDNFTFKEVMDLADKKMYEDKKKGGRNREEKPNL